ncbi:hypothetical protein RD792_011464 [Penstemon davidsonii]|uniref:MADS-box domain-containing protein n=1 Tax=Penstemon davidsonii TaxID=160366 RepID=A0ABR0D5F8_9LAMI|nr:hypothetical protein RD792_011464 [Penstemon davidsonii]
MTRKKVVIAYITNESRRKASFNKRKKGLIKKVSELSTLCGVETCAIVYKPNEPEPEVWPSQLGAQVVLERLHMLPQVDQMKRMVNQESFKRQQIKKAEDELYRLRKENKHKELELFMYRCIAGKASLRDFDWHDTIDMNFVIDETLKKINSRKNELSSVNGRHHSASSSYEVVNPAMTRDVHRNGSPLGPLNSSNTI